MKTMKSIFAATLVALSLNVSAQEQENEPVSFTVSRVIQAPAEKVWTVVGDDFGAIAYSHPKIVSSDYINGSFKGELGAERQCNLNDSETKYVREKILEYDAENMTFRVDVYQAGKLPIDKNWAVYKVERIDENSCRLVMDMWVSTDPAFMAKIAKGKFMKNIEDYLLAVDHHVMTGEKVTGDNFKEIKKKYKA